MLTLDERVWTRFARKIVWPGSITACWRWTACTDPAGYGRINIGGENTPAHRVAYMMMVGPIPEGLYIDHLCRTRNCVNPLHMEPVTHVENWRRGESPLARNLRKTHCPQGHEYSAENTIVRAHGGTGRRGALGRECRICANEASRRAHWRRQGFEVPPEDRPKNGLKTHCPQGHPYDEANTLRGRDGSRDCRICDRARTRLYAWRRSGREGTPPPPKPRPENRTHCPNGHEYSPENTRYVNSGRDGQYRTCRECSQAAGKRAYARLLAQRAQL